MYMSCVFTFAGERSQGCVVLHSLLKTSLQLRGALLHRVDALKKCIKNKQTYFVANWAVAACWVGRERTDCDARRLLL